MKLRDILNEGTPRKGDFITNSSGEIGLINKYNPRAEIAYVKYPSTNPKRFDQTFDLTDTGKKHKGKTLWLEG